MLYRAMDTLCIYCWGQIYNENENLWEEQYILLNDGTQQRNQYFYNRALDYYKYHGETYGSTLWQKSFSNEILAYQLIVGFETSSPNFVFLTNVQDPGEFDPTINNIEDISTSEITKTFQVSMPDAWNVVKGKFVESNPGDDNNIAIAINRYQNNDGQSESDTTKYIHFTLPKPWDVSITRGSVLHADDNPALVPTELNNVEVRKWLLNLPRVWNIQLGTLTTLDPVYNPSVDITNISPIGQTDHDSKYVYFSLPKTWDMVLGEDSGWSNPTEFASVSINRLPGDGTQVESTDTKYIHITIPNAWDIVNANDSEVVNPGVSPDVVIDRYATSNSSTESETTKYVHFKLPKAWNFALGNVELVLPNGNPEVVVNTESASGVTSLDTKYLHFKLPVAQEFTTDAFTIQLLGPTESPNVRTWFSGGDTSHRYPKIELSLPRTEKTIYGPAMAYTSDAIINYNGSTATDWNAISELTVGDIYINTTYAAVHKILTKTSTQATTEYLGSMQLAIPNIQGNAINPYDANGNPVVPNVATSAIGPVSSWNVSVDVIKAPVFEKSSRSGFVASTDSGEISTVAANNKITYTFRIPRGARINTNTEATIGQIVNPLDGDINIDENGGLRRYNGSLGQWSFQTSIRGNNFLIKNRSTIVITAADIANYTGTLYQKMGQYVADNLDAAYSTNLRANEILNIDYQSGQDVSSNHWLFKSNGEWTGSKLTGDVSNTIVENIWQDEPEDTKSYSVTLVNELRSVITTLQNKIANIDAAIEAAWGELPIIE